MHSELLNLWLFAGVLGKAATMTGIAPGILIFYAARMLVRTHRVPARGLFRKVVSDGNFDERTSGASPSLRRAA